jgi:hypothetical protein
MASRGRHTRSTPQLPLATPKADPEKIIRKVNSLHEGNSAAEPGISNDFYYPIGTPISYFQPSVGVSRTLNFGVFLLSFTLLV